MSFLNSLNPVRRFERQYAEYLISRFQSVPLPGGARIDLTRELVPIRGLQEFLASAASKPVLLVGEPGFGKTTALAQIALTHARALAAGDTLAHVPIFIPTRALGLTEFPRLGDLSPLLLGDVLASQCPPGYFRDAISSGGAVVLVDDLDVLPGDAVHALRQEFGNARIIAAAASPLPGLLEFPLPGWRDSDLRMFARHCGAEKAPGFVASLKASAVPRALSANPMMAALLARVWQGGQALPIRRTPLFDAYVDSILQEAGEVAPALEEAGLAALRSQSMSNGVLPQSRGFMRACKNHAAEFVHELWASYFAARALRRSGNPSALFESLSDRRWQEALVFFAGWGDPTDLIRSLVAHGNWDLAGRALANASHVPQDLRTAVTGELIRQAWEHDARAIAVLSEMNSETALAELSARLKDKEQDVRLHAVEILGQLRLDKGVDYLLPQLRDVSPEMRRKAVESLGLARTDRVVDPLLVALRGDGAGSRSDTQLRAAAARALGTVGSDRAVPALIVDMQFGEPEVRAAAAQALKSIPSPLKIEPLQGIVESGDDQARHDAAEILAISGNSSVNDRR